MKKRTFSGLMALRMTGCIVLLAGVIILRTFFPGAAETVRGAVLPIMEREIDYRGAITVIGETLTGETSILETLGDIYIWAFGGRSEADMEVQAQPEAEYEVPLPRPEGSENPPIESIIPIPTAPPIFPTPQLPEEEEIVEEPEAVAVFLAQQAAFSHYPLPPGVSFAYLPLEFAHAAPVSGPVSSPFGFRTHPIHGDVRFHFGTDIAVYTGTPVKAFAGGQVREAGQNDGFGLYILLDHGDGILTRYAHLSALLVEAGDSVEMGQIIGRTGSTGNSTGPHLHFELKIGGLYKNPEFYVRFG